MMVVESDSSLFLALLALPFPLPLPAADPTGSSTPDIPESRATNRARSRRQFFHFGPCAHLSSLARSAHNWCASGSFSRAASFEG